MSDYPPLLILPIYNLENTQATQGTSIADLQTTQGTHVTDISNLETTQTAQGYDITDLDTAQGIQGSIIINLTTTQTAHVTDISTLAATQATQGTSIADLENTQATQGISISNLITTQTAHVTDISTLAATQATQGISISTLESTQTTQGNNISNLTTTQTAQGYGITDLDTAQGLQGSIIVNLTATQTAHVTSISTLETKTQNITTNTTTTNINGALTMAGTTDAFTPPKLTITQRDALTPTEGNIIYNTSINSLDVYTNSAWRYIDNKDNNSIASIQPSVTMTSYSTPSPYSVSASSAHSSTYPSWKIYSDAATTGSGWLSAMAIYDSSGLYTGTNSLVIDGVQKFGEWVTIDLGLTYTALSVDITATDQTNNPRDFHIAGSNDNATWYSVGNPTDITWTAGETKNFILSNTGNYRYYTILTESVNGSQYLRLLLVNWNCVSISEAFREMPSVTDATEITAGLSLTDVDNTTLVLDNLGKYRVSLNSEYDLTQGVCACSVELTTLIASLTTNNSTTKTPRVAAGYGSNETLGPGYYTFAGATSHAGVLTLDAGNVPDAVFVFETGAAHTMAASSSTVLTNQARSCNVFWVCGAAIGLAASSDLKGTYISKSGASSLGANSIFDGRMFNVLGAISIGVGITATCPTDSSPLYLVGTVLKNTLLYTSNGAVSSGNTPGYTNSTPSTTWKIKTDDGLISNFPGFNGQYPMTITNVDATVAIYMNDILQPISLNTIKKPLSLSNHIHKECTIIVDSVAKKTLKVKAEITSYMGGIVLRNSSLYAVPI
jgi:hypothetical protein